MLSAKNGVVCAKNQRKWTGSGRVTSMCKNDKNEKGKITTVQGNLQGTISTKIKGKKGFGYDPIFIPKGHLLTFGQMSKIKKMQMDHRFLAYKKLLKKIKI